MHRAGHTREQQPQQRGFAVRVAAVTDLAVEASGVYWWCEALAHW
jgi:hypothetical protein